MTPHLEVVLIDGMLVPETKDRVTELVRRAVSPPPRRTNDTRLVAPFEEAA